MPRQLQRLLETPGLDRDEFLAAMLPTFRAGWQGSDPDMIEFGRSHGDAVVRLLFKDSDLVALEAGEHLTEQDFTLLDQLARDLASQGPLHFGKVILFARQPVEGYHRIGDILQIRPVPPSAPQPQFLMATDFPFLLEYSYPGSPNRDINARRRAQKARDLALLLNVLIVPSVTSQGRTSSFEWVRDPTANDGDGGFAYRQVGYGYPDFHFGSDGFSSADGFEPLQVIALEEYFARESYYIGQRFRVWNGFDELIDGFRQVPVQVKHRFLRSAHWFLGTGPLMRESASTAFLSLIMALEGLLPPRTGEHRCAVCNNVVGESGTERFVKFLEEHAPTSTVEEAAARRRLYRLRSRLAHGGDPFRMETETDLVLHPDTAREVSSVSGGWSLTKAVLITWLSSEIAKSNGERAPPSNGDRFT
jgi:hypothetical protein